MEKDKNKYTTAFGIPVGEDQNSLTAGERGPILMQDVHLLEKLGHFDRERIPERVVHAKGAGAHGYFEVTADVTKYTKAKFLSKVGKKTDVFARFSTVGAERVPPMPHEIQEALPLNFTRRKEITTWWETIHPSFLSGTRSNSLTSSIHRSVTRPRIYQTPICFGTSYP